MAGRKAKVTTNKKDRKYQRERTKRMQKHDANLSALQTTPPNYLNGVAKRAYRRIVQTLNSEGIIKQIDIHVVVSLCEQIQLSRRAYEHLFVGINGKKPEDIQQPIFKVIQDNDGNIVGHSFSGYRKNPAVQILVSSTAKIKSLCETLGMTPSSRASLLDLVKSDDDDDVSIDEAFKKSSKSMGF